MKKISVVTIAKNEEANIAACINSAKAWADEHKA
jgi:glycosyltransferase involved in cell wall biosynthesis